ncbi:hypothetical protein G6F62_013852 [Rhizopus arrhizus]|nr:hypothetical protein G6F62_013852 [Rhizopus arrhizus]
MPERLPRHTLVWLSAHAAWQADIAAHEARLANWFAQGLPAIVARRAADDADPRLRLGVPLPPAEGKLRLALRVPVRDVLRTAPPPSLHTVLEGNVAQDWQRPLQALHGIAAAHVFGAFAPMPWLHGCWPGKPNTAAGSMANCAWPAMPP